MGSLDRSGTVSTFEFVACLILYSCCSALLLVVNKVSLYYMAAPASLLILQLSVTAFFVAAFMACGMMPWESWTWSKVRAFFGVVLGFLGVIYANANVLKHANVETFIVFRTTVPLATSILDWFFLERELPGWGSWLSLGGILCGATGYLVYDSAYSVTAYSWVAVWFVLFCFDSIYIKHVCDNVQMSTWGRVLYTNALAVLPAMLLAAGGREYDVVMSSSIPVVGLLVIALSCLLGATMSYASFWLRQVASATTFTLVGVLCKILSVVVNCMIWDKHASPQGIACLVVCLVFGTLYKQSPKREDASRSPSTSPGARSPLQQMLTSKA